MRRLFWGSTVSYHFRAGRIAPLCSERHFQWGSPFISYENVSVCPSYGHFIVLKVYSSFFCSHSFISLSLISIIVIFCLFYRIYNFFSTYALCLVPLNDLDTPKAEEKGIFSCVCSRPYTSVWSWPIKSSKKIFTVFGRTNRDLTLSI